MEETIRKFKEHLAKMEAYDHAFGVLNYDSETVMPKGAFYIFADIRASGLSSQEFALRLLNDHAVACVPGAAFGPCGEGFVRMSYATTREKIKLAVERLAAFMRDLTEQV